MNSARPLAILGFCGLLLPLTLSVSAAAQQSTQPSQGNQAAVASQPSPQAAVNPLVVASRKAREQKAQQPNRTTKVYTNDDLATIKPDGVSIVGTAPEPPATAAGEKTPAAQPEAKDETYWRKRFADARRTLADDSKELDILQREFNLKQQQYYSDPNLALREQNDRQDLNDTQAKIDAKKADVDKDQLALQNLEDELRKAGGDPGWAVDESPTPQTAPAQPPSDAQPVQP